MFLCLTAFSFHRSAEQLRKKALCLSKNTADCTVRLARVLGYSELIAEVLLLKHSVNVTSILVSACVCTNPNGTHVIRRKINSAIIPAWTAARKLFERTRSHACAGSKSSFLSTFYFWYFWHDVQYCANRSTRCDLIELLEMNKVRQGEHVRWSCGNTG